MKKHASLLLALFLAACAHKPATLPELESQNDRSFALMNEISQQHANQPERLQISLRFGKEGNTRRVTGVLWGQQDDIRLDVMAGVGAIIAKIQDQGDKFLLYAPRENKAYEHEGQNKPLLRVGTPLPFDLQQLAALLNGNYVRVFGKAGNYLENDGNMAEYELEGSPGGRLWLASSGLPEQWREGPWQLKLDYQENQTAPHRLRLTNTDGNMAILLVKERESPGKPFTASQMELALPPGVNIQPLSQYQES